MNLIHVPTNKMIWLNPEPVLTTQNQLWWPSKHFCNFQLNTQLNALLSSAEDIFTKKIGMFDMCESENL